MGLVRLLATLLVGAVLTLPASAQFVGERLGRIWAGTNVADAVIDDDRAVIGYSAGLIAVFDVSDPLERRELGSVDLDDELIALVVDGDRAFAVGANQVHTIDLSTPARPRVLGAAALPEGTTPQQTARSGDALFVTLGDDGLAVFDVGDPDAPVFAALVHSVGTVGGVSVSGDRCYAGTMLLDISDPLSPVVLTDSMPRADIVVLDGSTAYVGQVAELIVLDVSDPANPSVLPGGEDYQDMYNFISAMALVDDVLYYAVWFEEDWDNPDCLIYSSNTVVYARDFSDPAEPQTVGSTGHYLVRVYDIHPAGSGVSYVSYGVLHSVELQVDLDQWVLPLGILAVEPTADEDRLLMLGGRPVSHGNYSLSYPQWVDASDPTRPRRIGFGAAPAL